jgi:hypothetical protein
MRVVEGAETMKFHGINQIGNIKAE